MRDTGVVAGPLPDVALPRVAGGTGLHVLAFLVCLYALTAAIQQAVVFSITVRDYLLLAIPPALCAVAISLGVQLLVRSRSGQAFDAAAFRRHALFAATAVLFLAIGLSGFTTYKLLIPTVTPFVWDAPFDAIDRALHGVAPWAITHAVLPPPIEEIIGTLYGMPWFLYWFGTFGFVVFRVGEPLRSQYLWCIALTFVLLGSVAATAFASHGPIFFPDFGLTGYEGLIAELERTELGRAMLANAQYLFSAHTGEMALLGGGISAMPSMHVAVVTLNLCLYTTLNRWLVIPTTVYATLIVIGSVHFGWHYAIDAYASLFAVPVLWWISGRLARNRQMRHPAVRA